MFKPRHFSVKELVCPHIYDKFGDTAFALFDDKLLSTLDFLRDQLGPIYINDWDSGGGFSQRGFRCIQCQLVKDAIKKNQLYVSAHMTGQAADFDVENKPSGEVRLWILANEIKMPHPIRLEKNVTWVHLDTRNTDDMKIILFNG